MLSVGLVLVIKVLDSVSFVEDASVVVATVVAELLVLVVLERTTVLEALEQS